MTQNKWTDNFSTFAVGVGAGALLALFFARSSGKEAREHISGTLKQGLDDVASAGKQWTRLAKEKVDDVKTNVAGAVEAGEKAYRAAMDA